MENSDPHRISTEEQLDALLGAPSSMTRRKLLTALDEMAVGFIKRSPLLVIGTAELTADPAVLDLLTARGAPALLAMRVAVRECFFHCGKALIRSALWQPETWAAHTRMSFGKQLGGGAEDLARKIDQAIEQDYKDNL